MSIENRNYKDSVFKMLFNNKKHLLELYNAINGTAYTNPNDLEIKTLKGNTFLKVKNDVSFIIDFQLNLYEHQSTLCPNIPLRDLYYVTSMLFEIIPLQKTYGTPRVDIPSPKFFVFYNGKEKMKDKVTYKLSDLYTTKEPNPSLELIVTTYNVNEGHNHNLMAACKALNGYSIFVSKVRKYIQEAENEFNATHSEPLNNLVDKDSIVKILISNSVKKAIDDCIAEDILAKFFRKNRQEVIKVSINEYISEEMAEVYIDSGQELIVALFKWLIQNNRRSDFDKAMSDPVYRKQLIDEFRSQHNAFDD